MNRCLERRGSIQSGHREYCHMADSKAIKNCLVGILDTLGPREISSSRVLDSTGGAVGLREGEYLLVFGDTYARPAMQFTMRRATKWRCVVQVSRLQCQGTSTRMIVNGFDYGFAGARLVVRWTCTKSTSYALRSGMRITYGNTGLSFPILYRF